jgi:arabinofuranosyltransferase
LSGTLGEGGAVSSFPAPVLAAGPVPVPVTLPPVPARDLQARRIVEIFLIAAFTYLFLANAWLGDDAFITLRVVWNLIHWYGPVFNPGERVQAYTHPLWMLVLACAYGVTREFLFTSLAVSYGFLVATLLRVVRTAPSQTAALFAAGLLASSKAFIDYTSSGLEYPLSYLLIAVFYGNFCRLDETELLTPRRLRMFGLIAGLAFVNRADSSLLYALPLAWMGWRVRQRRDLLTALAIPLSVPALSWLLFATFYYGFPLPNTYYAKVAAGIPKFLLYRQGLAYVFNSLSHDPITLATIGIASALALTNRLTCKLAAASALLYCAYTVSVGGDFMSGRFFTMPFLASVIALVRMLDGWKYDRAAAVGLLLYNVLTPLVPAKTTSAYDGAWPWRSQNGIRDERGHTHRSTNILFYSPFREIPDHTWRREGLSFRNGPSKVTIQGSIGVYGLMAGPEKHLIDRNALSDPLLARLPVSPRLWFEFYAGHYFRDIPDGYVESLETGENRLTDGPLHDYYGRLREVLAGPLLSMRRLRTIWYLNVGEGRTFAARYEQRRPIALSIRAANERFIVDAGEKDEPAGTIRSIGRAGYLQMGPGIPMKRGLYRARWVGAAANLPDDGVIGFVDLWAGERRIAKVDISAKDLRPDARQLAEVEFALPDPVASLEYRLWVDGRTAITLERVELSSVREIGSHQQ